MIRRSNYFNLLFLQERMPAVVISSPSRLRHFKFVPSLNSPSLGITTIFQGRVPIFHFISSISFLFSLFFEPLLKQEHVSPLSLMSLYHLSVTVTVTVPRTLSSLITRSPARAGARSIHLIIRDASDIFAAY